MATKIYNHKKGKWETCTVGAQCSYHHHHNKPASNDVRKISEKLITPPTDVKVTSWLGLENTVEKVLKIFLEPEHTVVKSGENDSNTTDVYVESSSGETFGVEVKQIPSAAGVQIVIKKNPEGEYVLNSEHNGSVEHAKNFLQIINKHFNKGYTVKKINLTGEDKNIAAQIFVNKYNTMSPPVKIVVASTVKGGTKKLQAKDLAAVPVTAEGLMDAFNIELSVRLKKSGSTKAGLKDVEQFKQLNSINNWGLPLTPKKTINKTKQYIPHGTPEEAVTKINQSLSDHRLYINEHKELRKLSGTNNTTAMLSLAKGANYDAFKQNIEKRIINITQ